MNRLYNQALVSRSLYGLLGLPFGIAWFTVFLFALGLSLGLLMVFVGFVLLSLTLRFAGIAADIERWLVHELLGTDIAPAPRLPRSQNPLARVTDPLRDQSYWRELIYLFMRLPSGIVGFAVTVVVWSFPAFAFSTLFWGWFVYGGWTLFVLGLGVVSLLVGPFVILAMSELQILLAQLLLGPSQAQLTERVDRAHQLRERSVEAAEAERRRIERDLHDGAQARLATVALDLGRARRKLEQGGSTEELAAIIDTAHDDAKAAIVELRDLARGIHPAVLADRGLEAALDDVSSRCSVPVVLDVRMTHRPSPHVEGASYFAVCELLTNMDRHSGAAHGWVTVRGDAERLLIDVTDDGVGGVDYALGTGMAGLHDRISAVDGSLSVTSPLGGGTTALIEVPIG